MNIKFIFASNKNNVVVVKKSRDNDVFKLKSFEFLKRIILEIESRTRIDKSDTRFRFISKRFLFRKFVKSRRKIIFSFEHLEDQIENSNDFDIHDDFDFIDVNNDENNDLFQIRQSRAKTTKNQNLKTYQTNLRRRLNIQKMKMTLNINLVAQRALFFFSHLSMFVVLFVFDFQNLFFRDVLLAHVVTNSYLNL